MRLTQFIRDRSDVELLRIAGTPPELWDRMNPWRLEDETRGCLLCVAFDCRSMRDYDAAAPYRTVERIYMDLAERNGDAPTGAMIARLARRELARRDSAVLASVVLPSVEVVG